MMTSQATLPSKEVLPGLSEMAFEKSKKEKLDDAIKFDQKVRDDFRLSYDQFIKEQEELSEFMQAQIDAKVKAEKEYANEYTAAQKTQLEKEKALQAENLALIKLMKDLSDIEKTIETQKGQLVEARQQSQSILKKITDKVVDAVSKLIGEENTQILKKAYAKQEQRMAAPLYTKLVEEKIKAVQETYKELPEDKQVVADTKLAEGLMAQQIALKAMILKKVMDKPYLKQYYELYEQMQKEIREASKQREDNIAELNKELNKAVERESLSDEEREKRYNVIYNDENEKTQTQIQKIEDKYAADVQNLRASYQMKKSSTRQVADILKNTRPEQLQLLAFNKVIVDASRKIKTNELRLETLQQNFLNGSVSDVPQTLFSQTEPKVKDVAPIITPQSRLIKGG